LSDWNFSAENFGIQCFQKKKEAEKHYDFFKNELKIKKISKIRYGRRRSIDSCYGFQRRYQESTTDTRYLKDGSTVRICGSYLPDADLEVFNMNFFEEVLA